MFGQNPILLPEPGDGRLLKIHSIFKTFQGEGPYVGRPAVFVRLSGCNLACNFCDTEFDSYTTENTSILISKIKELAKDKVKLIVITGGEPFRQNISSFCEMLINNGLDVQIETNGTLYRRIPKNVKVVCSPKNTGKGYAKIRDDLLGHTIAIKFLISANQLPYSNIAEVGQSIFKIPVYLQPMDEYCPKKNNINIKLTLQLAEEYGYRVGIQMHKVLSIE